MGILYLDKIKKLTDKSFCTHVVQIYQPFKPFSNLIFVKKCIHGYKFLQKVSEKLENVKELRRKRLINRLIADSEQKLNQLYSSKESITQMEL